MKRALIIIFIALLLAAAVAVFFAVNGTLSRSAAPSGQSLHQTGDRIKPEPTPEPTPEPAPEPTPDPTPEPTPEPTPDPSELTGDYAGEFSSDTGTSLNLIVRWAANRGSDGNYTVVLRFYLDCYALHVDVRDSNTLIVATSSGTRRFLFHTDSVAKEERARGEIQIGETTIQLTAGELASGATVSASWAFRGSYSGVALPEITAAGMISAS